MKNKLFLIFGIFVFLIGIIGIPFLIADNGSDSPESLIISDDSNYNFNDQVVVSDNYQSETSFGISNMKSGTVTFNEDCKADISGLLGVDFDLTVENGVTVFRDENSDKFVLTSFGSSDGLIEINNQKLFLGKDDKIIIDKDGFVTQGKFKAIEGESYDFAGFSISPSMGKVDFNIEEDNPFLILPDDSLINNFDEEKFKDLTIEGNGIRISDALAEKMFGGASEDFRKFSGKLKFEVASTRLKQQKYFVFIPPKEQISFPDAGISVECLGDLDIPIVFGGKNENIISHPNFKEIHTLGDTDYFLDRWIGDETRDFVSLGREEIYVYKNNEGNIFTLDIEEGSHYAGFNIEKKEHLQVSVPRGEVFIEKGKINVIRSNEAYRITIANGPDVCEVGDYIKLIPNEGEGGSYGTSFDVTALGIEMHGVGGPLFTFSVDDPEAFKKTKEGKFKIRLYRNYQEPIVYEEIEWGLYGPDFEGTFKELFIERMKVKKEASQIK